MDITPLVPKGKNIITAYGINYVIVNGNKYLAPLVITPDQLLLEASLEDLDVQMEVLIIGSSKTKPDHDLKAEIMSFGAACRTYNILLTEGRAVACFLRAD